MRVHFIAIGGSAMHNLAIALHLKGYHVTGSDDEIFDPAKSRLQKYGLLPQYIGWKPEVITTDLDAVILGMHAREDNPELLRAKELGIKIFSYPEYLYEQSKDKTRVVIGGSHGKTTITAMILHVLQHLGIDADYMVGAQLEGFEVMVRLSHEAKVMVIEGDEYLTSPIDRRPKFHLYQPNIAVISGIAWDHINVFPTFDIYKEQFAQFIRLIRPNGTLIYCADDKDVCSVADSVERNDITKTGYHTANYEIKDGTTYIISDNGSRTPLMIFGRHNLQNIMAAKNACNALGISDNDFLSAISTFKGASKRLELVKKDTQTAVYKDFAHAPSKLRATIAAMKEQYPDRKLVACMELHTFSSLTPEFLAQYAGCMDLADVPIVYFNPHAVAHKKLPPLDPEKVRAAFCNDKIHVFTDSALLRQDLTKRSWTGSNLLMMSSGNFDGIDFKELAEDIIRN
ncbi:MAG: peptidoglycan synthetase [Bacteroidales bacterium]|nr:peptidoglycan synthetase [Bacteroidales bacterium]